MKRYAISYMSVINGIPVAVSETDSPAEAYKMALAAQADGLNDVRVADTQTVTSHDPKSFAAMHKL